MTHIERRQQWKARIEAYKASGLSAREFCKQHNINKRQLLLDKKRNFERAN